MEEKNCPKCSTIKPLDQFGSNKSTQSGLQVYCRLCVAAYGRSQRIKNPEKVREYERAAARKHSKVRAERCKDYQKRNRESIKQKSREYYLANRGRILAEKKAYRDANYPRIAVLNADRRAAEKRARIKSASMSKMSAIYRAARQLTRDTGIIYHVDHIVPLKGETVCGLHVEWNMRIVTAEENMAKSNILYED